MTILAAFLFSIYSVFLLILGMVLGIRVRSGQSVLPSLPQIRRIKPIVTEKTSTRPMPTGA